MKITTWYDQEYRETGSKPSTESGFDFALPREIRYSMVVYFWQTMSWFISKLFRISCTSKIEFYSLNFISATGESFQGCQFMLFDIGIDKACARHCFEPSYSQVSTKTMSFEELFRTQQTLEEQYIIALLIYC